VTELCHQSTHHFCRALPAGKWRSNRTKFNFTGSDARGMWTAPPKQLCSITALPRVMSKQAVTRYTTIQTMSTPVSI